MAGAQGTHRQLRVRVGVVALLMGVAACGGSDGSGGSSGGDASPTTRSASGVISDWENACEVHDPEAVKDFMGIIEFTSQPGESVPGGGFSRDVVGCDIPTFYMPWERPVIGGGTDPDDRLRGGMVLRVNYYDSADGFAERHQNAYDVWAEGTASLAGRHIVDERTLEGPWEQGELFMASDSYDTLPAMSIVIAHTYSEGWSLGVEITYEIDPVHHNELQKKPAYPFTDEELAQWVADTYLPQVHNAVVTAVEAGA